MSDDPSAAGAGTSEQKADGIHGQSATDAQHGSESTDGESTGSETDYSRIVEGEYSKVLNDFVCTIYGYYENSIVYINKQDRIVIHGSYTPASRDIWPRVVELQNEPVDTLTLQQQRTYWGMLGIAMVESLDDGDRKLGVVVEVASKLLSSAESYRRKRLSEVSRQWVLEFCLCFAALAAMCGMCTYSVWHACISQHFGTSAPLIIVSGAFGAIGAFVSVCLRLGSWTVTPESGRLTHFLESFARIFAGFMAAVVLALGVRSGVLLASLSGSEQVLLLQALAVFAGVSERAIPHLAEQLPGAIPNSERSE
jgi:hypothetical protein